jgi:hypothetical protein
VRLNIRRYIKVFLPNMREIQKNHSFGKMGNYTNIFTPLSIIPSFRINQELRLWKHTGAARKIRLFGGSMRR